MATGADDRVIWVDVFALDYDDCLHQQESSGDPASESKTIDTNTSERPIAEKAYNQSLKDAISKPAHKLVVSFSRRQDSGTESLNGAGYATGYACKDIPNFAAACGATHLPWLITGYI